MSNVKTYIVTASWFEDSGVTLRVDHDILTPEVATEINTFWSGADGRLADENGNVVRTVVRMFGAAAIRFFMDDGGARFGPRSEDDRHFTAQVLDAQIEGWPDLDSLGILILTAEVSAVDYDDVTLEAV
jgi:hypothetical protein